MFTFVNKVIAMSKYGRVRSWRMKAKSEKKLENCFRMLHITSDVFNTKMSILISNVETKLKEMQSMKERIENQRNMIKELKRQVPAKAIEKPKVKPQLQLQPQPNKPIQRDNPPAKKELPKTGWFTCALDRKAYQLKDLPCLVDPNKRCPNKLCEKQVLALIKQ